MMTFNTLKIPFNRKKRGVQVLNENYEILAKLADVRLVVKKTMLFDAKQY